MKKRYFVLVLFFCICFTSCGMNRLPEGEFIAAYDSPESFYTLNIYLCSGNATTDFAIRGELCTNETGQTKNIYWGYHEDEANVEWISDTIVIINGITLDISKNETFDWRK